MNNMSNKILLLSVLFLNILFANAQCDNLERLRSKENTDQIWVVAHRADYVFAPENSIDALNNAIFFGADIIETDVRMTKDNKSLWGYIDTKGEVVFVPEKDMIFIEEEFSEGLMPVAKGKELSVKCGYVNTKGEVVIPFEYDIAEGFIDGTATAIKDKSLMVVLNPKGEIIEQETIDPEDLEEELEDFLDIFF